MRGLKDRLISELQSGKLAWVLEVVKGNPKLFLSIEQNYISIYYRGKSIVDIKPGGGYSFIIDEKYFTTPELKEEYAIFNRDKKASGVYQRKFPILIEAMDASYGTVCHPQDENKQAVANTNPFILAFDYKIPVTMGEGVVDMIGIHDGSLVAFQHNLGGPVGTLTASYKALEKIWADPTEKENLIQSANTVASNMAALGLIETAPQVTNPDLIFVPLLTDCAASPDVKAELQGSLPVKAIFLDGANHVVDMSKAI